MNGYHVGRTWAGNHIERACRCPFAPCGLVDTATANTDCTHHGASYTKTMLQGHPASACPGELHPTTKTPTPKEPPVKRALAAIAVTSAALLATACQPAPPVTGVIIGKDFDRGSCTTTYKTKTSTSSTKPATKTSTVKCKNDEYELDVRTDQGKVREVEVDPITFMQVNIGDRWPKVNP